MDTSHKTELVEYVKNLPKVPGVYKFKNSKGTIIYVGKAKSLRDRVGSYFLSGIAPGTKTYALVQRISEIEYIEAHSEFEALLLEAELIKKFRPKYNIALKDDKSYLYIVIRDKWVNLNGSRYKIPVVLTARKTDLILKDTIFGPYVDGATAKYVLRILRRIFPFRDCSQTKFNRYHKLGKPCLYGFIGVCNGPCANYSSENLAEYRRNLAAIKNLLQGESSKIIHSLEKDMQAAAKKEEFEKAAKYRDLLNKFEYVRKTSITVDDYIKNPYLVQDTIDESLQALEDIVPVLNKMPERIECYDISNISGKEAVGSMVVAAHGRIDKSEYRKFKIKFKDQPDDFAMMFEVLFRRLKREKSESERMKKWGLPDLIVVDGGKGQVSMALEAMSDVGVNVPVIGLAKKFETIVYKDPDSEEYKEINVEGSNPGLLLLIRLRDEAHRFAQSYHHKLRIKKIREN